MPTKISQLQSGTPAVDDEVASHDVSGSDTDRHNVGDLLRLGYIDNPDQYLAAIHARHPDVDPISGNEKSFSRSSDARYRDRKETLQTASSGALREHWVKDEDGFWVPSLRLEAARTNRYTQSEDLSHADWTKSNTSITADDATAPDNNTTADKVVEDDTAAGSEHKVDQSLPTGNISDDTDQTASVHGVDAERNWLAIRTTDQNGDTATSWVDLSDGSKGTTAAGHTVRVESDWTGDHHRVAVTFDSDSGATTPTVEYLLADADGSVSYDGDGSSGLHLWGFQFEADSSFPSSYTPTTSSAVSRAADDLSFPIGFGPQELTVYTKHVWRGGSLVGEDTRFYVIGGDGAESNTLALDPASGGLQTVLIDKDGQFQTTGGVGSPSVGEVVESMMVLDPAGDTVKIKVSVDGGAVAENSTSTGSGLASSWFENTLQFGKSSSDLNGLADYISGPIIAPGVRSMGEMRNLAGTA